MPRRGVSLAAPCRTGAYHRGAPGPLWIMLAPVLLSACSNGSDAMPDVAEGEERIACAVGGSADMAEVCAIDRSEQDGTLYLVVRHPDGAFRRFEVLTDGRGLATADGAQVAETMLDNGQLEVTVGEDRDRFPATVRKNVEVADDAATS